MVRYLILRMLQLIPVLLGVAAVSFVAVRLIPGDPAVVALGNTATPGQLSQFRETHGLNGSLPAQLIQYYDDLVHLDLGQSIFFRESAGQLIVERLPATLCLLLMGLALGAATASVLAAISVSRQQGWRDHAVRAVFTVLLSIPGFWLGSLLLFVFAVQLRWFPVSGVGAGMAAIPHLVLPVLTLAAGVVPAIGRSLRSSVAEVAQMDYVNFARSLGLPKSRVLFSFIGRNASRSLVTITAVNLGWIISTSVVVENVFGFGGLGSLLVQSVSTRDYALIQGVSLAFALIVVLGNLAADFLVAAIDPRVRFVDAR